jgi:hypothetical protein
MRGLDTGASASLVYSAQYQQMQRSLLQDSEERPHVGRPGRGCSEEVSAHKPQPHVYRGMHGMLDYKPEAANHRQKMGRSTCKTTRILLIDDRGYLTQTILAS